LESDINTINKETKYLYNKIRVTPLKYQEQRYALIEEYRSLMKEKIKKNQDLDKLLKLLDRVTTPVMPKHEEKNNQKTKEITKWTKKEKERKNKVLWLCPTCRAG